MITDVRDVYFQADPFPLLAPELAKGKDLFVFEEGRCRPLEVPSAVSTRVACGAIANEKVCAPGGSRCLVVWCPKAHKKGPGLVWHPHKAFEPL